MPACPTIIRFCLNLPAAHGEQSRLLSILGVFYRRWDHTPISAGSSVEERQNPSLGAAGSNPARRTIQHGTAATVAQGKSTGIRIRGSPVRNWPVAPTTQPIRFFHRQAPQAIQASANPESAMANGQQLRRLNNRNFCLRGLAVVSCKGRARGSGIPEHLPKTSHAHPCYRHR